MASATPAAGAYAPDYAWVGAPAIYNGTGKTGGDSGTEYNSLHAQVLIPELVLQIP
jgi:hypothetical protein